jgi:uncharacterized protein YtpQ (UPF0354 family)
VEAEPLGPFEEARGQIYPVVRGAEFGRQVTVPVLRRPLVPLELDVYYAIDTGRTLRFVGEQDLKTWPGVSVEDVDFYARENLFALSEDVKVTPMASPEGETVALAFVTGDGHDASRVLLPNLVEKLAPILGESILVGIPNRDFLIAFRDDGGEMTERFAQRVLEDSQTQAYAISGKLFRLTPAGLVPREAT